MGTSSPTAAQDTAQLFSRDQIEHGVLSPGPLSLRKFTPRRFYRSIYSIVAPLYSYFYPVPLSNSVWFGPLSSR